MLIRSALATLLFTGLLQTQAHALKVLVRLSPPIQTSEFVFEAEPLENGKTRITIRRNPLKAETPRNPALHLVRGATLKVNGPDESVVTVSVASGQDKDGWLTYRFTIDNDYLPHSKFTLSEIEDSKWGGYIGGGTIYEFSLVEQATREQELKKLIESIATPNLSAEEIEKLRKSSPVVEATKPLPTEENSTVEE